MVIVDAPVLLAEDLLEWGRGWVAVSKPAGISLHNDPGKDLCSVTVQYVEQNPELAGAIGYDPEFGFHPPHRLDKETSGVVILACTAAALRWISQQFEQRRVAKQYAALVHGDVSVPEGASWGEWRWPLSKAAGGRTTPAGKGKKVPCRTHFRDLHHSPRYTLIECRPITGRKHQIRRHARLAGHAVVGDARYGTPQSIRYLNNKGFNRLGLHAMSITLVLPDTLLPATLTSREIPADIIHLLEEDAAGKETQDSVTG